ncbi:hypothetical protein [Corynebacterium cystitidis]|uniref:hypothetical protein n=1 Tax=Corynebacterium cystitidis TaxID=35757 RepID=UPI00211E30F0|nr:hypothetical protein [Corynebacterium cystitidis]
MKQVIAPGVLDEIAHHAGARSDKELAAFIGITEKDLEALRYGATTAGIVAFAAKAQAHRKAADMLSDAANNKPAA